MADDPVNGGGPEPQRYRFWAGFCAGGVVTGWIVALGAALFQRGGVVDPSGFFAGAAATLLIFFMLVALLFAVGLSKEDPPKKAPEK